MYQWNNGLGASITDITEGLTSLLGPIAQTAAAIYASDQQLKAQKALLKLQAQPIAQLPVIVQSGSNSNLLIGVAVGGVFLVGLVLIMALKKKSPLGPSGEGERRIKRIRRISKP